METLKMTHSEPNLPVNSGNFQFDMNFEPKYELKCEPLRRFGPMLNLSSRNDHGRISPCVPRYKPPSQIVKENFTRNINTDLKRSTSSDEDLDLIKLKRSASKKFELSEAN
jgi:hypothetical protein